MGAPFFRVWRPLVRWVIPIAIGVVLVFGVSEKLNRAIACAAEPGAESCL
jgi:hypothetical protein